MSEETKSEEFLVDPKDVCEDDVLVPYHKVELAPTTHVMNHPLIEHKLSIMRNRETPVSEFRRLLEEITVLLCYEAMKDLELEEYELVTPICRTIGKKVSGKKLTLAPIMRAGLGMEPAVKDVVPVSRTGHVGMYRDEVTLEPHDYYWKMPKEIERRQTFVLDPMLATGGSANDAIAKLKEVGCESISFMCVIAAPQGVDVLQTNHPDVNLYIAHLDKGLNKASYIVPGLGDAGDRIFGTK